LSLLLHVLLYVCIISVPASNVRTDEVPTRLARNVSSNNGVSVQPKNRYALETTVLGLEG